VRVCFIRVYVFASVATFNTVFFSFFLQTRRLSRPSFSLHHFLLTINFLIYLGTIAAKILETDVVNKQIEYNRSKSGAIIVLFFSIAFPLSPLLAYQVPCGRLVFSLYAAGLRGTFPGHPRPPSLLLFWTTQHEYNTTSMGGPSGLGFEPC
jgi:hypothetical protein